MFHTNKTKFFKPEDVANERSMDGNSARAFLERRRQARRVSSPKPTTSQVPQQVKNKRQKQSRSSGNKRKANRSPTPAGLPKPSKSKQARVDFAAKSMPSEATNPMDRKQRFAEGTQELRQYLIDFQQGKINGKFKPKPHQHKALYEYYQTRKVSDKNVVVAQATGTGKTFIFALLAKITGAKTLIVVPRLNLITQTINSFHKFAPELKVSRLKSSNRSLRQSTCDVRILNSNVLIICYQTLKNYYQMIPWQQIDTVVLDEAHNCLSAASVKMIKHIDTQGCHITAYTATPILNLKRSSKDKGILSVYTLLGLDAEGIDNPIPRLPLKEAIEIGANAPVVTAIVYPTESKGMKLKARSGVDISEKQAAKLINQEFYNKLIVDVYLNGQDQATGNFFRGSQFVIFAAGIDHAAAVANEFNKIAIDLVDPDNKLRERYAKNVAEQYYQQLSCLGKAIRDKEIAHANELKQKARQEFGIAKAVYSNNPNSNLDPLSTKECQEIIDDYKLGRYLILTGADKLTEGFDHKNILGIIWARPTQSDVVKIQGSGRGLRGSFCYVIDIKWGDTDCKYFYEYISSPDETRFEYGKKVNLIRKYVGARDLKPIPIEGAAKAQMIWGPQNGAIILKPVKNKAQAKAGMGLINITSRKLTIEELAIGEGAKRLFNEIEKLNAVFSNLHAKTLGKSQTIAEAIKVKDAGTSGLTATKQASQYIETTSKTETILATRQLENTLEQAKRRLSHINAYLMPLTKKLKRSGSSGGGNAIHFQTIQQGFAALVTQYTQLSTRILQLLKDSNMSSGKELAPDFKSSEFAGEVQSIINKMEDLQQHIARLGKIITQHQDELLSQINSIKQTQSSFIKDISSKGESTAARDGTSESMQLAQDYLAKNPQLTIFDLNSISAKNKKGKNRLIDGSLCKLLVERGNLGTKEGLSPEHYYALKGTASHNFYQFMSCLVNSENVNDKDYKGNNLLHNIIASKRNERDTLTVVKLLIGKGIELNQLDAQSRPPLFLALLKKYFCLAMFLVANGARINAILDPVELRQLFTESQINGIHAILAIDNYNNIMLVDAMNENLLHKFVRLNSEAMINYLRAQSDKTFSAMANTPSRFHRTPLGIALVSFSSRSKLRAKIIKLLLKYTDKAYLSRLDHSGTAPVHQVFTAHGPVYEFSNSYSRSVSLYFKRLTHVIDNYLDVGHLNCRNIDGDTPMHLFMMLLADLTMVREKPDNELKALVASLVKNEINASVPNYHDKTPVMLLTEKWLIKQHKLILEIRSDRTLCKTMLTIINMLVDKEKSKLYFSETDRVLLKDLANKFKSHGALKVAAPPMNYSSDMNISQFFSPINQNPQIKDIDIKEHEYDGAVDDSKDITMSVLDNFSRLAREENQKTHDVLTIDESSRLANFDDITADEFIDHILSPN